MLDGLSRGEIQRSDLEGKNVWLRVEQEPCSSCASGLDSDAKPGVIAQFSKMFPELTIEVRSPRDSHLYIVQDGKIVH